MRVARTYVLPHDSEIILPVTVSQYRNSTVLLEPLTKQSPILVAQCVVSLDNSSRACLRLLNAGNKDLTLRRHTVIAQASLVETETITVFMSQNDDTGTPRNSSSKCSQCHKPTDTATFKIDLDKPTCLLASMVS